MNDSTLQPLTPSWSELYAMILATSEQMKETDRRMQETDRKMQETDRRIKEMHEETERYLKETYEKTEQQIKEINKNYGGLKSFRELIRWNANPISHRFVGLAS